MQRLQRLLFTVLSHDLEKSKAFYTRLFEFDVDYDSDWFVHLISPGSPFELGLISATSEWAPAGLQAGQHGSYPTFVVEDAGAVYEAACEAGFDIAQPLEDTPYGQRRLLLRSPEGAVVDVSSPIPDFQSQG